jgi:hypothetical protein
MKYALSIVARMLDTFGNDIGLAYDIMCAFMKTLARSSLGVQVKSQRLIGVVPAFHGHAHNRACQVRWHPMYINGVGLEDFEECERTFARSNELANCTRLATPFHRRQEILEHFNFHDQDKQMKIGSDFSITPASTTNRLMQGNLFIITTVRHLTESGLIAPP